MELFVFILTTGVFIAVARLVGVRESIGRLVLAYVVGWFFARLPWWVF